MKRIILLITFLVLISCTKKDTEIRLPKLFSDHVVLQQKAEVTIWGWSTPEIEVNVTTTWGTDSKTKSNKEGKWTLKLQTVTAGGPYEITINAGDKTKVVKDVLIGEVWLASGQSNMEMPLKGYSTTSGIDNSKEEIASSDYPLIRMFTVARKKSFTPEEDCEGEWLLSNPNNSKEFSATAYFFAKKLYKKLNVPVGIINSSWGGTPAEAWTPLAYVSKVKGFENTEKHLSESISKRDSVLNWLNSLEHVDLEVALANKFENLKNDEKYSSADFDHTDWKNMKIPSLWEQEHLKNFDGIVWFRKDFEISNGVNVNNLKLFLGKIDDMDETYINGIKIGSRLTKGFWNVDRLYPIDNSILHVGKNTISIKVIDDFGGGGLYGEKDLGILDEESNVIVNLSGNWKFYPVATIVEGKVYNFDMHNSYVSMPKSYFSLQEHKPTVLYNGMIAPLQSFSIKGVIWYQGESNVGRAEQYQTLFPTMIKSWREAWKIDDLPFYYVQIAPYNYGRTDTTASAKLRYAQFLTLREKNVGMAVITDVGDVNDIHPSNKQDVGSRLALWALNKTYHLDTIIYSGPLYSKTEFKGNKAVLSFTNIADGLVCRGKELNHFEIAGSDTVYYKANAKIVNDKVVLFSKNVAQPLYIRFGWSNNAVPNLFNTAGLPASPFKN